MKIRKALMLAEQGGKVRKGSWRKGEYVYCETGCYWLVTAGIKPDFPFIAHPADVRSTDWEVVE